MCFLFESILRTSIEGRFSQHAKLISITHISLAHLPPFNNQHELLFYPSLFLLSAYLLLFCLYMQTFCPYHTGKKKRTFKWQILPMHLYKTQ